MTWCPLKPPPFGQGVIALLVESRNGTDRRVYAAVPDFHDEELRWMIGTSGANFVQLNSGWVPKGWRPLADAIVLPVEPGGVVPLPQACHRIVQWPMRPVSDVAPRVQPFDGYSAAEMIAYGQDCVAAAAKAAPVAIEVKPCPDDGSLVTSEGHRLAYGGVPREWRVKPEDFPPACAMIAAQIRAARAADEGGEP